MKYAELFTLKFSTQMRIRHRSLSPTDIVKAKKMASKNNLFDSLGRHVELSMFLSYLSEKFFFFIQSLTSSGVDRLSTYTSGVFVTSK